MSIIDEIGAGARLSVFLQPDHGVIPSTIPEYNEALALPFVCTEAEYFTGSTRPSHYHHDGLNNVEILGFAYTNSLPCYSIINPSRITPKGTGPSQIAVKLMSRYQYRVLNFTTRPAGRHMLTVNPDGVEHHGDLRASLEAGCQHYAVIRIDDERIWSLPIDISYDFFPTGRLEFVTEAYYTSQHCQFPKTFRQEMSGANPDLETAMENPLFNAQLSLPLASTFLRITMEGLFQDKTPGAIPSPYRQLDVYEYP